jgi:diaminohydroxyphosphoribosylaminopyrimidine deaminase / 5-amino-6-(5-phosphoribosylamino)uracil reductase
MNKQTTHDLPVNSKIEPERDADPAWLTLVTNRRGFKTQADGHPIYDLYAPLCATLPKVMFSIAHLAQSLDGRIATVNGSSRWISGDADLLHTHRMRALADAVIVGASTVYHDNPQLTVRRCVGPNPVRVVIDPEWRLDGSQNVFQDGLASTLWLVADERVGAHRYQCQAEIVPIARSGGRLDPNAIKVALAARGLYWLFIEGGGVTVSHFLHAQALNRLQLTIAPLLLGSGRSSVTLPENNDLGSGLRPYVRRFQLGIDTMIECTFNE